jgi:hypothetical protein
MNLDRVSQSAQLAANLGVIISILFLGYQISEHRDLTRAQTRSSIASAAIGLLSSEALDAEMAGIVYRNNQGEELSGVEQFRLERLMYAYFRMWEDAHYQYRHGLYDEPEFAGARQAWKIRLNRPRVASIWCRARVMHSPEFVAEVERLLPAEACKPTA